MIDDEMDHVGDGRSRCPIATSCPLRPWSTDDARRLIDLLHDLIEATCAAHARELTTDWTLGPRGDSRERLEDLDPDDDDEDIPW
ncbi:MAG: hypothetical protein HYV09_10880 [Deltaproteobacteria bacterium]|nr:hypothetical protein [Deltaproteobacteria bacterium]